MRYTASGMAVFHHMELRCIAPEGDCGISEFIGRSDGNVEEIHPSGKETDGHTSFAIVCYNDGLAPYAIIAGNYQTVANMVFERHRPPTVKARWNTRIL